MCWVRRVLFPRDYQRRREQWERWEILAEAHHRALAHLEQEMQQDERHLQDPRLWRETHEPFPPRRPP